MPVPAVDFDLISSLALFVRSAMIPDTPLVRHARISEQRGFYYVDI